MNIRDAIARSRTRDEIVDIFPDSDAVRVKYITQLRRLSTGRGGDADCEEFWRTDGRNGRVIWIVRVYDIAGENDG